MIPFAGRRTRFLLSISHSNELFGYGVVPYDRDHSRCSATESIHRL